MATFCVLAAYSGITLFAGFLAAVEAGGFFFENDPAPAYSDVSYYSNQDPGFYLRSDDSRSGDIELQRSFFLDRAHTTVTPGTFSSSSTPPVRPDATSEPSRSKLETNFLFSSAASFNSWLQETLGNQSFPTWLQNTRFEAGWPLRLSSSPGSFSHRVPLNFAFQKLHRLSPWIHHSTHSVHLLFCMFVCVFCIPNYVTNIGSAAATAFCPRRLCRGSDMTDADWRVATEEGTHIMLSLAGQVRILRRHGKG